MSCRQQNIKTQKNAVELGLFNTNLLRFKKYLSFILPKAWQIFQSTQIARGFVSFPPVHTTHTFSYASLPTFTLKKRIDMVMRANELTFAEVEIGAILMRQEIAPIRQAMPCFTVYVYGIV